MRVLVLNPGSSTLKGSLVTVGSREAKSVLVEWPPGDDAATAPEVVRSLLDRIPSGADAVGYRVVHGGTAYRSPTRVDAELLSTVENLDELAPLHNRRAAAVMRAGAAALPDLPHVACFDTAFHAHLPEEAWRYPLPPEWVEHWGIRRFGFHGLSVAWSTRRAGELLGRPSTELRLVVAHLGSGCSVTAVDRGRSVDTSMGFTPFEGLMMGTRSGSVDPGILLHLLRNGVQTEELADGIAHRSGLLGVAGAAGAREIEQRAQRGDERARLALDMFARRAAAAIGSAATAFPGIDALVFTGGIGENSPAIRGDIVRRLAVLGLPDDLARDPLDAVAAEGPPAVLVVAAREDLVIGAEVAASLGDG
jgi:acetate kinase